MCRLEGLDGLAAHAHSAGAVGATGRWRGVPFLRNKSQCDSGVRPYHPQCCTVGTCKRALPALANPDTKDLLDSCMTNWSGWGLVVSETMHRWAPAASCAVLAEEEAELKIWHSPDTRVDTTSRSNLSPVRSTSERAQKPKTFCGISGQSADLVD